MICDGRMLGNAFHQSICTLIIEHQIAKGFLGIAQDFG